MQIVWHKSTWTNSVNEIGEDLRHRVYSDGFLIITVSKAISLRYTLESYVVTKNFKSREKSGEEHELKREHSI